MQPYQHTANFVPAIWTGWIARPDRGRLRLTGADAGSFLQALVTNDVTSLGLGESCDALLLTPQGRMLADLSVFCGRDEWLISVPAPLAESLTMRLDFSVFTEDVQVANASQLIHQITLVRDGMHEQQDLYYDAEGEAALFKQLREAGVEQLSVEEAEALRIKAGRPKWGVDMTEDTIPLEAGLLDRAISQTKGCYPGQEVIVRVLHRGGGRVAKRLMRITFPFEQLDVPAAGTAITIGGAEVGKITSAAHTRNRAEVVALGYVQRDHAVEGTAIMVGHAPAVVGEACR